MAKEEQKRVERNKEFGCYYDENFGHEYCPDWQKGIDL